jgi:hypothetical protein
MNTRNSKPIGPTDTADPTDTPDTCEGATPARVDSPSSPSSLDSPAPAALDSVKPSVEKRQIVVQRSQSGIPVVEVGSTEAANDTAEALRRPPWPSESESSDAHDSHSEADDKDAPGNWLVDPTSEPVEPNEPA